MEIDMERISSGCECGKVHAISTKIITVESKATSKIADIAGELGFESGGRVLCDSNTKIYADAVAEKLGSLLRDVSPVVVLNREGLMVNEQGITDSEQALGDDSGWIIAVGAGVIHDLARRVAFKRKIPFLSYPTACTTDGYASSVCTATLRGFKKTLLGTAPLAIIADTDVFSEAPYRLTASGIGDVLSKYTALADWRCAGLLTNEDFCENIFSIIKQSVDDVREYLPAIHAGEKDAYEMLMHSLLISGAAMQAWGDSRPAAGSERHLAHLWEMGILSDKPQALYGELTGVGLLAALRYYETLAKLGSIEGKLQPYGGMPLPLMRKKLGMLYEDILRENQPDPLRSVSLERLAEVFPQIQKIIRELPNARKLRPFMQAAGCVTTMEEIGIKREILPDSIVMAPFMQRRLTIMRAAKLLS